MLKHKALMESVSSNLHNVFKKLQKFVIAQTKNSCETALQAADKYAVPFHIYNIG